jgi:hypothetical protein
MREIMTMRPGLGDVSRDRRETAAYITTMARDLKQIAARADLGFLAYLLSMVEDDAAATMRKLGEDDAGSR